MIDDTLMWDFLLWMKVWKSVSVKFRRHSMASWCDFLQYLRMERPTMSCTQMTPPANPSSLHPATASIAQGQWVKGEVEGRGTLTYGVNPSWNLQPFFTCRSPKNDLTIWHPFAKLGQSHMKFRIFSLVVSWQDGRKQYIGQLGATTWVLLIVFELNVFELKDHQRWAQAKLPI